MKTFACWLCNSKKPCILTGIDSDDDTPDTCVVGGESDWVEVESVTDLTRVVPEEPFDKKEYDADLELNSQKERKLLDK